MVETLANELANITSWLPEPLAKDEYSSLDDIF